MSVVIAELFSDASTDHYVMSKSSSSSAGRKTIQSVEIWILYLQLRLIYATIDYRLIYLVSSSQG